MMEPNHWNDKAEDLTNQLIDSIRHHGPMPFSDYMNRCLYEPILGYYQSRNHPIGAQGDFITAPEMSPLFSHCLARQWLDLKQTIPESGILEIGAGSGRMASDIIHYCKAQQALPPCYWILETSALLQSEQHSLLKKEHPDYIDQITWITQWPEHFCGLILGNEVLDAMPIERVQYNNGWQREYITLDKEDNLCFTYKTLPSNLSLPSLNKIPCIPGYHTEVSTLIPAWVKSASQALQQGLILLIDYGYPEHEFYHSERKTGTLTCHHRHKTNHDPLWLPGCQDITAHVNFTQVAEAALDYDLELEGYCHQAALLMNLGITELPLHEETQQAFKTSQSLKQLLMPQEMGEKFKAIGLGKGLLQKPLCFRQIDQRHYLFK